MMRLINKILSAKGLKAVTNGEYENILNELNEAKQRADWFRSKGYGKRNLKEED